MVPKRPKFGLFFEKFSLGVFCLCPPTNWPKTGGQIWGPSAFKTRQTVGETGSVGSARSSAELPHDSLRDFEGASPAICGRRPPSGPRSADRSAQRCDRPIAKLESRGSRGFREYPRGCRPSTTTRKPGLRLVFIKTMGLEMLKNPG